MSGNGAPAGWSREWASGSEEETRALGERLAALLRPGDIVLISGELGAGKTRLVQGIARGLGVASAVTSPTFSLVKEYAGRMPLYHMDLYRLAAPDLAALGLEEYFLGEGVTCVEWGERADGLAAYWSEDALLIELEWGAGEGRRIRARTFGPGWADRAPAPGEGE